MATFITARQHIPTVPAAPAVVAVPLLTQARLCHLTASRMIAALDAHLTRLDAVPIDDGAAWHEGTIVYGHARYRWPNDQRPAWWPWRPSLREALYQSYGVAIQLRGKIMEQEQLWRQCWPVAAMLALDDRAHQLRVDLHREWSTYRELATDPPTRVIVQRRRRGALQNQGVA